MKPRIMIAVLLVIALTVPASMLAQQNSKAEQEVRASLDQDTQVILKGGAEAVAVFDKYYADDYTRITSDGSAFTKAETLDGFRTGKTKVDSVETSDVRIRTYGKTAVVTGIVKAKGTTLGVPNSPTGVRFTRVFVKHGGNWQCVLYQTTRIAP